MRRFLHLVALPTQVSQGQHHPAPKAHHERKTMNQFGKRPSLTEEMYGRLETLANSRRRLLESAEMHERQARDDRDAAAEDQRLSDEYEAVLSAIVDASPEQANGFSFVRRVSDIAEIK